jgi:hypothetical protein
MLAVAVALAAALPAVFRPADPAVALANALRRAYEPPVGPSARWRRRPLVTLPDGREVPRDEAWRDDPRFVPAARALLARRSVDDARLGAWLLGSTREPWRVDAADALAPALSRRDPAVAFEAALALAAVGAASERGRAALAEAARFSPVPEVRSAAAWATGASPGGETPLAPGFRRGVSWWNEDGRDAAAASFRRLATMGVTWVSIHTWDPLQRGLHEPVIAVPRAGDRHWGLDDLPGLVRDAHAAGLRVMVKPHLEMRPAWMLDDHGLRAERDSLPRSERGVPGGATQHPPAQEEDRRVFRSGDEAARQALFKKLESRFLGAEHLDHNKVEMRSEADWRTWFASYEAYLMPYVRDARAAGADAFCVGRELDATVLRREGDWRRVIAAVRREFDAPLTYSANFDTWQGLGFWDALDFIGVSAYFPLAQGDDPSPAELDAGWDKALAPLEAAHLKWGRPVLLTEAGFPSIAGAARAPWREERTAADVWLQARCYDATLRALAKRPWVEGAFFWLWERTARPPFRDPSHAIVDKPASFTMARWYASHRVESR